MAKFLPPDQVGLYGLIAATLGWVLYFVGCEFYAFSTRDIIGRPLSDLLGLLRDQALFFVLAHAIAWPIVILGFGAGWLPWQYCVWFLALLALEHIGLELGRILVAVSEPIVASVVLFLRGGLWCIVAVAVMWRLPEARNLGFLFGAWSIGGLLACSVGFYKVLRNDKSSLFRKVDWRWIAKGLSVAMPLMLASLAIRGMLTIDRYWVERAADQSVLGAYVLFASLAMAVLSFLDAGVVDFAYPKIVVSVKSADAREFSLQMRKFAINVVVTVVVLSVACWLVSGILLTWLDKPVYEDNAFLLPWLLIATGVYGVSTIPHVGLYAHGRDKTIVLSQVLALCVFVFVATFGSASFGVLIVPYALIAAFSVILIWKSIGYAMMRRSPSLWSHPAVSGGGNSTP